MQNILFSGSSNIPLARQLAGLLRWPLGKIEISKFSDGETYINIKDDVSRKNVFILQSCQNPANDNFLELLMIIDAIRRLAPRKITAVLPFYAYRRQEKKTRRGESVTAQLFARLLEAAGADKIITADIHTDKILNFFKIPAQNIEATPLFLKYFKKLGTKNLMVIAPDRGAYKDAKRFAKKIGAGVSYLEKKRDKKHSQIRSMKIHARVKDKDILIIDDEIDTAGTLSKAAELLKRHGAGNIYAACTHAVFSGPAISRLKKSSIREIVATNTICLSHEKTSSLGKKIKILSIAPILARHLNH